MLFKIITKKASEYAEWMSDNGVRKMIWDLEDCPILEIQSINWHGFKKVKMSRRPNSWIIKPTGSNMMVSAFGDKYELYLD